jgi:putative membrane-bound dehydrogenase-like protein
MTSSPAPRHHRFRCSRIAGALVCVGVSIAGEAGSPVGGATAIPPELFRVPDGLEVTLWATSPMLYNPTSIDVDAQGRIYVAEGVNYRGKAGRRSEGDRIVVLEDTTGAGKADKVTVFLQRPKVQVPLGLAVLGDQVVVAQSPELQVYRDTNHDLRFDPATDGYEVLLSGLGPQQHDHGLHGLVTGPDGRWYFTLGNKGATFTDRSQRTIRLHDTSESRRWGKVAETIPPVSHDGRQWLGGATIRIQPDGSSATVLSHNSRNVYDQAITSFGDIFQSDNDDPPACRVSAVLEGGNAGYVSADGRRSWGADRRPGQSVPIAQWRQDDPGTMPAGDVYGSGAPAGMAFYENGILGDRWRGLLLACDAGRNVVFGYLPKPNGAGFTLERFDFLTTQPPDAAPIKDASGAKNPAELRTWFRPSDVCVGADGAIYVADWFDAGVGSHATFDDHGYGAIYRIAPKGSTPRTPALDLTTTAGQIAALKSPAAQVRYQGFTRLLAQGPRILPEVTAVFQDPDPYLAARAAWLLIRLGDQGGSLLSHWLDAADDFKRLVAYRATRSIGYLELPMAGRMVSDASAAVRREVAISLRDVPVEDSLGLLVRLGKRFDGKDRAYLEAFGIGCTGKEAAVYRELAASMGADPLRWSDAMAGIAWRLHPPEAVPAFMTRVRSEQLSKEQRTQMLTALAFVPTREAAAAMIELAHARNFPLRELAEWWLLNRKNNDWKDFGIDEALKALGLYDPATVTLVAAPMPPEPANPAPLPSASEIATLPGDATRGQAAALICQTCHRIGASGAEFGPDLSAFGKQQGTAAIIQHILQPSAAIAHGFDGSEITTTDGLVITGIVLSAGDPVLIKCMGGRIQTVPQSRIKTLTRMERSLMYSPQQLGLTAQGIADIVAYLKSR